MIDCLLWPSTYGDRHNLGTTASFAGSPRKPNVEFSAPTSLLVFLEAAQAAGLLYIYLELPDVAMIQ